MAKKSSSTAKKDLSALLDNSLDKSGDTIRDTKLDKTPDNFRLIPIKSIRPSATNPRKTFDEELISELAESIQEHGILQPILVREIDAGDSFEVISGERRYRAATVAKLVEVPCIIKQLSDAQVFEVQIIENLQRTDIHPMDEAAAFQNLIDNSGLSIQEIARRIGKSSHYVVRRSKLIQLTDAWKKNFFEGKVQLAAALEIARLTPEDQKDTMEYFQGYNHEITLNRVKHHIENNVTRNLKKCLFNQEDENLIPAAGACSTCPKRSGFQKTLFHDIEDDDRCFDQNCFESKKVAHIIASFEKLQKKHPNIQPAAYWESSEIKQLKKYLPADMQKIRFNVYSGDLLYGMKACPSCQPVMSLDNEKSICKLRFVCLASQGCERKTDKSSSRSTAETTEVAKVKKELQRADQLPWEKLNKELSDAEVIESAVPKDAQQIRSFTPGELMQIEEWVQLILVDEIGDSYAAKFAKLARIALVDEDGEAIVEDEEGQNDSFWYWQATHADRINIAHSTVNDLRLNPLFRLAAFYKYILRNKSADYNAQEWAPIKAAAAKMLGVDMTERIEELQLKYSKKKDKLSEKLDSLQKEEATA